MLKLRSDLGQKYAETLNKRAIEEIAAWCEQARDGLSGEQGFDAWADFDIYDKAALTLRAIAEHAA